MTRLIDADALKNELAPQSDWTWANGAYVKDMIDAMPTVGGWISVNDKLPPSQKSVLLAVKSNYNGHYTITVGAHCNDHEITTDYYGWQDYEGDTEYDEEKDCYWVKGGWWETNYVEDNENWEIDIADATITHWMPLPEPPKEDDDDAEQ